MICCRSLGEDTFLICMVQCSSFCHFAGIVHFSRLATVLLLHAPAEVRGACSGSSESRILVKNHGGSFRPARAEQDKGDPTNRKYVCLLVVAVVSCLITPSLELSTEAATAQQQLFVKLCLLRRPRTAHFVCVHMWAVVPVDLRSRNKHIQILEVAINWILRRGQTTIRTNSHLLGVSKATAQPRCALQQQQQQQQQYNSSVRIVCVCSVH